MADKKLTIRQLCELIGARSPSTVWRWLLPEDRPQHRKPNARYLRKLHKVSDGAITADSFHPLKAAA